MHTALYLLAMIVIMTSAAQGAAVLPSGVDNPLPIKYPQLKSSPAPASIAEGLRATYSVIASSSESERSRDLEESGGSTGAGLSQVDVVAIEGGLAATQTIPYVPSLSGAMRMAAGFGSVSPVGCGAFWCSPQVLWEIPEQATEDLTVSRAPFVGLDQQFDSIMFYFRSDTLEMSMVYDLQSGILLRHTVDYTSQAETSPQTLLSRGTHAIYQLRNLRPVDVPWKDGRVSAWLKAQPAMAMQGQTAIQVSGASPSYFPVSMQIAIQEVGSRFTRDSLTLTSSDPIPSSYYIEGVTGVCQLMGTWVPTEALSTPAGLLDSDPDTGMVVRVVQSGPEGLVMEKSNQVDFAERFSYDHSGRLIQIYQEFNPDVTTSVGFGSVKVIQMDLVS